MAGKETFRERQENELEVIQSIFGVDAVDLRTDNIEWTPLNLIISLEPQRGSSGSAEAYAKTKLHVVCPTKYPKQIPKITIEKSKGLSDTQIDELTRDLNKLANELKGEVMIYELAQVVQAYLHKHNKPPTGSFYDQMLLEKHKRDSDFQQMEQLKLTQQQQMIRDEVLKRKKMFRNESKTSRDTRRSVSESSPTHRTTSLSDISELSSTVFRCHIYPNECTDHRSSDTLYFSNVGRKIQKGCCLGHSQKGYIAFSGIDLESGQLLYITEWNIKYVMFEYKCIANCNRSGDQKCNGHTVDDIIQSIERQVNTLSQLRHKNLITYECVLCMKKKEGVMLYLVQDFVLGTSVNSITGSLGWCIEGASIVARGVLDALIFLHNKGVSHNNLYDCTVFMDNSGTIRVTDFGLVPYLLDLIGVQKSNENDLPALGALIELLSPIPHADMRDFIEKCKSPRTLSSSDLVEHPFLRPIIQRAAPIRAIVQTDELGVVNERSRRHAESPPPITSDRSRLNTEFEILQWLGKGAYGDVLKVRNILDNREYAIKRISITKSRNKIYKKMTREVEVLSRLNHENVVRYYNSWIESANVVGEDAPNSLASGDWSASCDKSVKQVRVIHTDQSSSSSDDWLGQGAADSSSGGVEFRNSDGELVDFEDEEASKTYEATNRSAFKSPRPETQIMYIQMEFCEKSTLRTAIDGGLYCETDRLWQLFREIVEGLSHIHQQNMIHRDLKPVNIFLDSRGQAKIGDFGLATTSFLALQSQEQQLHIENQREIGNSLTGKVGTALYVAPELMGNAYKSTYNQKVDLYSLGIILFEMSHKPFDTAMERHQVIATLRSPNVVVPSDMLYDIKYSQNIKVIKWLLSHDPAKRPTAEELLASELVPPAQLEANELQEMLRHALANPQSKAYKHLVARCLAQKSDTVLELTYHLGLVPISPVLELVKGKIIALFRKHGGEEVVTPLLSPLIKHSSSNLDVKLMTHSGSVVTLPHDLRVPFVKHIALVGKNRIRRYSVGRVYREKKAFNFHPKQLYECAFDIITPNPGSLLVDAEIISIAYEITNEIATINQKNISFRLNHTSLLQAILVYCNVPTDKYHELFAAVLDLIEDKISKFQLHSTLTAIMQSSKYSATQLMDLLMVEFPLGGSRGSFSGSSIRTLLKNRGEVSLLAKAAMKDLEAVAGFAQLMGVSCPINAFAGLPIGYDRCKSGGIVWQMIGDMKTRKRTGHFILALGGRYDGMLAEFQKQAHNVGVAAPAISKSISGVGFSFALDKIISVLNHSLRGDEFRSMDVVICVTVGSVVREVALILRSLWSAGIRAGIVEESDPEEALDVARNLKALHVILFSEGGTFCVRSWNQHDDFCEKYMSRQELPEYIHKMMTEQGSNNNNETLCDRANSNNNSSSTSLNLSGSKNSTFLSTGPILPSFQVTFVTPEKQTSNMRRRIENQLTQNMTPSLILFGKKEFVHIVVVDLPSNVLKAVAGAIDPRDVKFKETREDISGVTERFPKFKRYILQIFDEIMDILTVKKNPPILGLYSLLDASYRIIL